jgi:hypothetical protein
VQIVGREALDALTAAVKRDFHDPESLRASLETLLVIFMYEDHPVFSPQSLNVTVVATSTGSLAEVTRFLHKGCCPLVRELTN